MQGDEQWKWSSFLIQLGSFFIFRNMFFVDDTTPVTQYNLKTTLSNITGISVNHDQSCVSIKQKCTVYGISLYTCKYSPLCSLRDWKLLVPANTSVPYYIAVVTSLINKQHIIMRHFIDVHKILQLVIFAAAIIILGMVLRYCTFSDNPEA